jgi:hypothetical protein
LEKSAPKFPILGNPERLLRLKLAVLLAWFATTDAFAGAKNWRNIVALRNEPPWVPERYRLSREDDFADYIEAGQWIGSNAPPDAIVFCRKALFIELAAQRDCAYYSSSASPEELWGAVQAAAAKRPVMVLRDNFPAASTYGRLRESLLMPMLRGHADVWSPIHATAGGSEVLLLESGR